LLGHRHGPAKIVHLMQARADLLLREYDEINAHLRANTGQFVNWFSLFLTFSLVAAAAFAGLPHFLPSPPDPALRHGVPAVFLLMHMLAFVGIVTFRRYIVAAHRRVAKIAEQLGESGESPVPVRFCQWMTDLMGAGYMVSYFTWFALLFLP
jgi:hypothetical protein